MKKILLVVTMLSLYLYATPKTLNDEFSMRLVTSLEKFTPTCSYYSKTIKASSRIKQLCQKYDRNLNSTLKLGYKLDQSIVSKTHTHLYNGKMHTCTNQSMKETSYNPVLLKAYTTKLLDLDKLREQIIEDVDREKNKAKRSYDITYHEKLIRKDVIPLYPSDYIFIAEHKEVYANADTRYIDMLKDEKVQRMLQKHREDLAMQQKEEERR